MKKIKFVLRAVWAILTASVYQVITNPHVAAGLAALVSAGLALFGKPFSYLLIASAWYMLAYHAVVAWAVWRAVERPSRIYPYLTIRTAPDYLFLVGNEQEGYDSPFARSLHPTWKPFIRQFVWAAWRNKTSNVRFTFVSWLHQPPDPARIEYISPSPGTWVCWQGWRTNWQWVREDGSWTEIGWRYEPSDKRFTDPGDWRQFGCGVAFRLNGRP